MNAKKLRAEIQRTTRPDGRRHFNKELRAKVKAAVFSMRETGVSQVEIADTLNISPMTVGRYLRVQAPKTSVRPVAIAATAAPCVVMTTTFAKVTTPAGFEVEGLGVDDIAILIRSLS